MDRNAVKPGENRYCFLRSGTGYAGFEGKETEGRGTELRFLRSVLALDEP